jgi:acetyl esterase/lipase
MLAADAIELARGLESAGASCRLEVWPDQMHVFQALPRVVPEADRALDTAAEFIDDQLEVQRRRSALTLVPTAQEA